MPSIGHPFRPYRLFDGIHIPECLLDVEALSFGSKMLYGVLVRYIGRQNDDCWPKQETLGKRMGVSERSIRNYLKELEDFGLVRSTQVGLTCSNHYECIWHPIFENELKTGTANFAGQEPAIASGQEPAIASGHIKPINETYQKKEKNPLPPLKEPVEEPPETTEQLSETDLNLEDPIEVFTANAYKREGRGRIKLGRKTDTRIVERLTDLESRSGPQEFRAALLRFLGTETEWLKENKWPLNAFLKEWEVWAVDKPARAARPAAPDRRSPALPHTTPPSSSNPSERVVAPAAGRDFAAEWDAAIPARPSLYDAGLDGDGSYKKCAADPEFCKQYAKVLEQARLAIGDDGSGASWITFDWILKRDKESGQWNWRKVLKGSYAPRKASAAQAAEDDPFTRIRMKMKKAKEEREKANEQV